MPISSGVNVDKVAQKVWEYSPRLEQYRSCVASDTLQLSADTDRLTAYDVVGSNFTKTKEFVVPYNGSYRIKLDSAQTMGFNYCWFDIRKNGTSLTGNIQTESQYPSYTNYSYDFSANAGDLIQVYAKPYSSSGADIRIKNCRLCYTVSTADSPAKVALD